jgi:phosphoribosylaminoimidazole carboxylase (NCAIR synthetase)
MKSLCYSVRLSSLTAISDKCYKATAFDGSEALIPKSQVFGQDYSVQKSEAYWISEWILKQKSLQYSGKKQATFDSVTRKEVPTWTIEKHEPTKIDPLENNTIKELKR